jgi:hypothetical protein
MRRRIKAEASVLGNALQIKPGTQLALPEGDDAKTARYKALKRAAALKRRAKCIEAKLCPHCRAPAAEGHRACDACLSRLRQRIVDLKAKGICTQCGKMPAIRGRNCHACAERRCEISLALTKRRQEKGLCLTCGGKRDALPAKDCRSCKWKATLARAEKEYGLTVERWTQMMFEQKGACLICKKEPEPGSMKHRLHVDHHHPTKIVRGLLCGNCNRGIGLFFESPELLRAAAAYSEGWIAKALPISA